MSKELTPLTIAQTGSAVAISAGATVSLRRTESLLNSSFEHIIAGNYTLYLADVVTIIGVLLSAAGVTVAVLRYLTDRNRAKEQSHGDIGSANRPVS